MLEKTNVESQTLKYGTEKKAFRLKKPTPAAIILNEELYNNFDKERVMGLEEVVENEEDLVFQN